MIIDYFLFNHISTMNIYMYLQVSGKHQRISYNNIEVKKDKERQIALSVLCSHFTIVCQVKGF